MTTNSSRCPGGDAISFASFECGVRRTIFARSLNSLLEMKGEFGEVAG